MTRKLQTLLDRRNTHLEKQANAIRLIIEKSVDPQLTGTLLSDIIMSVSQDRELILAIDAELERSRKSWWSRYLQGA